MPRRGATSSAVLLDIGGTLWPDAFEEDPALRLGRLTRALPEAHRNLAEALAADLEALAYGVRAQRDDDLTQDSLGLIIDSLRRLGIPGDQDVADRVRRAMVVPARPGRLFRGAREVLAALREEDARVVAVSNTLWRTAEDYRRDFEMNGVGGHFTAILTSLDEGIRKPDLRIFLRALSFAGTDPERAVVIGNSERMDIQPGRQLGMRTVLVAIEEPPPPRSAADAVTDSLMALRDVLVSWLGRGHV